MTIIPLLKNRTVSATWNLLSKAKCDLDPESQLRDCLLVAKSPQDTVVYSYENTCVCQAAACEEQQLLLVGLGLSDCALLPLGSCCVHTGYAKTSKLLFIHHKRSSTTLHP